MTVVSAIEAAERNVGVRLREHERDVAGDDRFDGGDDERRNHVGGGEIAGQQTAAESLT